MARLQCRPAVRWQAARQVLQPVFSRASSGAIAAAHIGSKPYHIPTRLQLNIGTKLKFGAVEDGRQMENCSFKRSGIVAGSRSEVGGQIGGRCYHSVCAHRRHTAWQINQSGVSKLHLCRGLGSSAGCLAGCRARLLLWRYATCWPQRPTSRCAPAM